MYVKGARGLYLARVPLTHTDAFTLQCLPPEVFWERLQHSGWKDGWNLGDRNKSWSIQHWNIFQ